MQLERILRSQGFGSRPESRTLICSGKVYVDGLLCDDPYADYETEDLRFSVDGIEWIYREFTYLLLNKPSNFECSHKPKFHRSIYSLLTKQLVNRGVQAVGRLDEDTTGLLLLSDDGQFIHKYTSPKKQIPKVYDISTKHLIDDAQINSLLNGVKLNDEQENVRATHCVLLDEKLLRMTVTEGKYHLVKRMIAASGNRVEALNRVSIGGLNLSGDIKVGEWCWLETSDLKLLAEY